MSAAVAIGALRRRVALQRPADAPDGAGGVVRGYAGLAEVFATVEPVSAREAETGRSLGLKRLWTVTLRARSGLDGGCRVVWGALTLDVLSVRPLDADGRFTELLCEETAP